MLSTVINIRQLNRMNENVSEYIDLRNSDLYNAYLRNAYLRYADLYNADLYNANLSYADLRHADLRHADLRHADLRYADLRYADLYNADLGYADLRHADLGNANLRCANLDQTAFRNANLSYADLRHANTEYCELGGTCLIPKGMIRTLPDTDLSDFSNYIEDNRFVVGYRTKISYKGNFDYLVKHEYEADLFCIDTTVECGHGIYLAPNPWDASIPASPLVVVLALKSETIKAGNKYRARRVYVLREYAEVG